MKRIESAADVNLWSFKLVPCAVLQSDTTALGFIRRQTSCVGLPVFLPKLVVIFLRTCGRFPGKEASTALHLPSFTFWDIHNSQSCLVVCLSFCFALFVLSFFVYLTMLSVARYMYSVNWQDDQWIVNWKGWERNRQWLNIRQRPEMCLKELRNATKGLSQAGQMSR
jgi:hypothetical protein